MDDFTAGSPPHAGSEKLRRNLYWRNHVRTSCGKSDVLKSQEGQESLCWWLCSVRDLDPEKKKKVKIRMRKTNKAKNPHLEPKHHQ